MGVPFWNDKPGLYDTVYMAGKPLLGVCTLRGGKRKCRTDKKKTAGQDGAHLTHLGYDPVELDIVLKMWEPEHWENFLKLLPIIQPKPDKKPPVPVDVSHPFLAAFGIRSLYVSEISIPEQASGNGVFHVTIRTSEWSPAQKKKKSSVSTPDASRSGISGFPTAPLPGESHITPPSHHEAKP